MIVTTATFDSMAARGTLTPVYRFSVDNYSRVFVYRPTGRTNEVAWIESIQDWGVSIDPTNGSYTIDDLTLAVIDKNAAITTDLGLVLLEGRRCQLQIGFDGLPLADYCTVFNGIVNTVTTNGDGTYNFTCNDFNRLNQRVIYITGDSTTTTTTVTTYNPDQPYTKLIRTYATDPVTGVVTPTATVSYQTTGATGPTGTFTTRVGDTTTILEVTSRVVNYGQGNVTIYESTQTVTTPSTVTVTELKQQGWQIYTNIITTETVDNYNDTVSTTLDVTYTASGTVGTTILVASDATTSSNPRHIIAHPLDILLNILQNEIGYADHDINIAQIQSYRDTVWTGVEFEFLITGSVDAKDFIENELLKPLGGYLYENAAGQFCIGFAQPPAGGITPVADLNPKNLNTLPSLDVADLVNVVTMRFDKDDFGVGNTQTGFLAEANTFYAPSIADLPDLTGQVAAEAVTGAGAVQGQLIIESSGVRSGFQGFLLAKMISNSLFSMYGFYNPQLEAQAQWDATFRVELGEFVTVTHPLLQNRATGKMGFDHRLFKVIKRSYNFSTMEVTLLLQDASGIKAVNARRIAPTGKGAYTADSTNDQQRYLFMSTQDGKMSNGDAAGRLG